MTIILQPIASGSTTPSAVELTSDNLRIVRAAIPTSEGCAIRTKRKQIRSEKGQAIAIEWTLTDDSGNPIDLTSFLSDGSLSASVSEAGTFEVRARFAPCDVSPCQTILEKTGVVADAEAGTVQFAVPDEFSTDSGIYLVQVALVRTSDEKTIIVNTFLWSVEEGLWGDTSSLSGPPSLAEIRIHLRDTSVENDLLDDVEFDNEEIVHAIVRPVRQWNETPPPVAYFSCRNFPFRYHWLQGIVGELLRTAAHHYMRNNLNVSHGGVQGNFKDKYREYLQLAQLYSQEWTDFINMKKIEINAAGAMGSAWSNYSGGW